MHHAKGKKLILKIIFTIQKLSWIGTTQGDGKPPIALSVPLLLSVAEANQQRASDLVISYAWNYTFLGQVIWDLIRRTVNIFVPKLQANVLNWLLLCSSQFFMFCSNSIFCTKQYILTGIKFSPRDISRSHEVWSDGPQTKQQPPGQWALLEQKMEAQMKKNDYF